MAIKGASARAAARKQRDKWKSKRWYDIRAPRTPWSYQIIGETIAEDDSRVLGRIYEITQHELDGDFSRMHVKLRFRVIETLNRDALTQFIGHEVMQDHMRRQVRRYRGKMDDVIDVITIDGYHIRVKPLIISQRRINSSRKSAIRELTRDVVMQAGGTSTWVDLQKSILDGTLERDIKDVAVKIHPIRNVMIRKSEMCQSGVLSEDGPTLDDILDEEKRSEAGEAVQVKVSEGTDVLAAAEAGEVISETVKDSKESPEEAEVEDEDTSAEGESEEPEDSQVEEVEEPAAVEAADTVDDSSAVDYASMTVAELKVLLREAGKPVSGKKSDLISRLNE
jgi:small subunit ribosomal protein S3Ae